MMIVIAAAVAVVCFVIGIALVYQASLKLADEAPGVPTEEFVSLQGELDRVRGEGDELKGQIEMLRLELEAARVAVASGAQSVEETERLRALEQQHQDQIRKLQLNLEFLARKADEQAQKAIEAIRQLDRERSQLQQDVQRIEDEQASARVDEMEAARAEMLRQLEDNQTRLSVMEKELSDEKARSVKELEEAEAEIHRLRIQNTEFQQGIAGLTAKIARVRDEVARIQGEKDRELDEARVCIARLQEEQRRVDQGEVASDASEVAAMRRELEVLRAGHEGRLLEAHDNIERLQQEIQRLQREMVVNRQDRECLEDLVRAGRSDEAGGIAQLKEEKARSDARIAELNEMNGLLLEQEQILSEELVKSQALAMGLQKICEEFNRP